MANDPNTKKVRVDTKDADEFTKAQILTGNVNGVLQFAAHEDSADRVKIKNNTELVVMKTPIRGGGASNPDYYYIADSSKNPEKLRRYFIKKEDAKDV